MISKIFLGLISISIFAFLIFFTFISNNLNNFEIPYYEKIDLWLFELNNDEENKISLNKLSKENSYSWKILVEKINISDKIIFTSWSIETKNDKWTIVITITPWIYFFDLKEINLKYIIKWKWFEITNKWPWIFFINNLNSRKNIVFSINSLLDLNLKNIKNDDNITSLDLYPHSYLIFNPQKNIFVKNSDLLKISQVFTLWYFGNKIITINENTIISEKFINLISLKDKNYNKLIENSLLLIKQELDSSTTIIDNFIKYNFSLLPWEEFINKYFFILINPNKKNLYYKNIIIRNLHKLIKDKNINVDEYDNLIKNYNTLKQIDKKWSEELKNIIKYYYKSIIKSNNDLEKKVQFSKLINKINNTNYISNLSSPIFLEQIFLSYEYLTNNNFYKDISIFTQKYINELNNSVENTNKDTYNIEKVDYLLYFLENILLTSNFSSSNIDTKDLIIIFNDYIEIANWFYSYSNEKVKRTWLFTNSKILNKFNTIIVNKYFEKNRDNNNLLIIKKDLSISENEVILLEKNINNIFNYYNNNVLYLNANINNKDKFIIKLYSTLNKKYTEYFSALKNYKEYILLYDKRKNELLNTNTINENNELLVLSIKSAKKYLNQFNWIQTINTKITVMGYNYCLYPNDKNEQLPIKIPYCYKINNLNVDSNNVSFLLHPFEKNRIDEIIIENEIKSWSYKLDEIKLFLDEKQKTNSQSNNQYDFNNFLISTFWQKKLKNLDTNELVNNNQTTIYEDPIIKIFKRNKLLWNSWDFINLEWFLTINYNNLIVKKQNNKDYSIEINDSLFNLQLWKNKDYSWLFTSIYIFNPKHSFINPKIKLIEKKYKKKLLLWNYIYIIWEYKVNDIKTEFRNVFNDYEKIKYIVDNVNQILWINDIKITYIKNINNINFEFKYLNSAIYIKLKNWKISKFKYNGINKVKFSTPYKEINNILNKIKQ